VVHDVPKRQLTNLKALTTLGKDLVRSTPSPSSKLDSTQSKVVMNTAKFMARSVLKADLFDYKMHVKWITDLKLEGAVVVE